MSLSWPPPKPLLPHRGASPYPTEVSNSAATPWAVVTPEAVPLELVPAGLGSRLLALGLDWLAQGLLAMSVLLAFSPFADSIPQGLGVALLLVFVTFVVLGYPAIFETMWRGRTPGKAAMGLRVVTNEGGPVRFRHAVTRAVLGLVDFAITSGGAAVISVLATRDNRRLGDLVAGTLVLRERSGLKPPVPVTFQPPEGLADYAAALDVSRLGADAYGLIRNFLLRAATMPPAARYHLSLQVAGPVAARVAPVPPAGIDAESFLVTVAAAFQRGSVRWGGMTAAHPAGAPTPASSQAVGPLPHAGPSAWGGMTAAHPAGAPGPQVVAPQSADPESPADEWPPPSGPPAGFAPLG